MAELRNYRPTIRERVAWQLMRAFGNERSPILERTFKNAVDLTPLGLAASVQESRRDPDPTAAKTGMALMGGNPSRRTVKSVAEAVAKELGLPVRHSTSAGGKSSYLDDGSVGGIRISDHGLGGSRSDVEGIGYSFEDGEEAILASIRERLRRGEARKQARKAQEALERQRRWNETAEIRAEHAQNRAAKLKFFEENGLTGATETARKKAWKEHRRRHGGSSE